MDYFEAYRRVVGDAQGELRVARAPMPHECKLPKLAVPKLRADGTEGPSKLQALSVGTTFKCQCGKLYEVRGANATGGKTGGLAWYTRQSVDMPADRRCAIAAWAAASMFLLAFFVLGFVLVLPALQWLLLSLLAGCAWGGLVYLAIPFVVRRQRTWQQQGDDVFVLSTAAEFNELAGVYNDVPAERCDLHARLEEICG